MKFLAPRPNLIESDSGFSVVGRTGLRYVEGERVMFIDSEVLAKPRALALWRESVTRWDHPHEADVVGPEDRSRIIENIRRAFESQARNTRSANTV